MANRRYTRENSTKRANPGADTAGSEDEHPARRDRGVHAVKKPAPQMRLTSIRPMSDNQGAALSKFREGFNLVLSGTARTGKTFLASYLAAAEVEAGRAEKFYVIRSAVPARDIGFLPGKIEEKIKIYEQPVQEIINALYGTPTAYHNLKVANRAEFMCTSFMRGLTLENAVVVLDEAQNMTFQEINTIITRMWDTNVRIIVCGDVRQCDINERDSGFKRALAAFRNMSSFAEIQFTVDDLRGAPLVREWLIASGQT